MGCIQQESGENRGNNQCELDDRTIEMTQSEQQRANRLKNNNKPSLMDLWHYFIIKDFYFTS